MKEENKSRALDALMTTNTLTEAAEVAGIDRRTLYNFLHSDKQFALQYKLRCELRSIEIADSLRAQREKAYSVIQEIMSDTSQPGAVRLKAAGMLLDEANKQQADASGIARENYSDIIGAGFLGVDCFP